MSTEHVTELIGGNRFFTLKGAFQIDPVQSDQVTVSLNESGYRSLIRAGGRTRTADSPPDTVNLHMPGDIDAAECRDGCAHFLGVQRAMEARQDEPKIRQWYRVEGYTDPVAANLLRAIAASRSDPCPLLAESAIAALFFRVHYWFSAKGVRDLAGCRRRIERAVEYARENLARRITLDELADAAGMSRYHFARMFKGVTGSAPHAFVMKARVERARDLLRTSRLSIAEIAYLCGFSSQSHLTRSFQRDGGVTPDAFRRLN